MTDSRDKFIQQLQSKKDEVEQALNRLIENQREDNDKLSQDGLADESDFAQREALLHENYSLIERKTRELKRIEYMIQKLSKDEKFGRCEECGRMIPSERLLAVPDATLCVPCQQELERFDKMRRPPLDSPSPYGRGKGARWVAPEKVDDGLEDTVSTDLDFLTTVDPEGADADDLPDEK